jgi:hypothetical protein
MHIVKELKNRRGEEHPSLSTLLIAKHGTNSNHPDQETVLRCDGSLCCLEGHSADRVWKRGWIRGGEGASLSTLLMVGGFNLLQALVGTENPVACT